ncbi:hypothetical protein M23134_00560 [Microscilla marina ATCC 23134]|uniref:Uncharacterized protein n=1 Tax=Microscilla marina ATCC 23134 TaxID=313606 RepID=A1ZJE0_MICM2|nr:hypothetical protein M23134_00560 [Microscilla marina ATCC 23134]
MSGSINSPQGIAVSKNKDAKQCPPTQLKLSDKYTSRNYINPSPNFAY